jgi:hypothetical protein
MVAFHGSRCVAKDGPPMAHLQSETRGKRASTVRSRRWSWAAAALSVGASVAAYMFVASHPGLAHLHWLACAPQGWHPGILAATQNSAERTFTLRAQRCLLRAGTSSARHHGLVPGGARRVRFAACSLKASC